VTTLCGQVQKIKVQKLKFVPASYPGGKDSLTKYFDRTIVDKLKYRLNVPDKIQFRSWVDINAEGKITKVNLVKGSGYPDIDSTFVDAVRKMPFWTPATNEIGNKCKDKQFLPLNIKFDDLDLY